MNNLKQLAHIGVLDVLDVIHSHKSQRFTDIANATGMKPVPLSRALPVTIKLGLATKRPLGGGQYAHDITPKGKETLKLAKKLIEVLEK